MVTKSLSNCCTSWRQTKLPSGATNRAFGVNIPAMAAGAFRDSPGRTNGTPPKFAPPSPAAENRYVVRIHRQPTTSRRSAHHTSPMPRACWSARWTVLAQHRARPATVACGGQSCCPCCKLIRWWPSRAVDDIDECRHGERLKQIGPVAPNQSLYLPRISGHEHDGDILPVGF
jgi:hypothetical protein